MYSLLCVSVKFQPISAEGTETQYTRVQVSLLQFISRYSPEIQVLILYYHNAIQTLIWYHIAWALCDLPRKSVGSQICQVFLDCKAHGTEAVYVNVRVSFFLSSVAFEVIPLV